MDIDIAIVGEELAMSDQAELVGKIEELPVAQFVDLVRYDAINSDELRVQIDKYGIELHSIQSSKKKIDDKYGVALKKLAEL